MIWNHFSGKKVLVTGNTGFKGSWLCLWLHQLGADVIGYANEIPTQPSLFEILGLERRIKWTKADILDSDSLDRIIKNEKPEYIFHLAGQSLLSRSFSEPFYTFKVNTIGTVNLFEALRKIEFQCQAVIVTSDKCYENAGKATGYTETDRLGGKDVYSASKGSAELAFHAWFHSFFCKKNNLRIATARAGNIIGSCDFSDGRLVPDSISSWKKGVPVELRNPSSVRPWQHILDALHGYLRLAVSLKENAGINGESFNFSPSESNAITAGELVSQLAREINFSTKPFFVQSRSNFTEAELLLLNSDKAAELLNWTSAFTIEESIRHTASGYEIFYSNPSEMMPECLEQIGFFREKLKETPNSISV